jgi:hypothetical protein
VQILWLVTYKKLAREVHSARLRGGPDQLLCFDRIDGVDRTLEDQRTMQLIGSRLGFLTFPQRVVVREKRSAATFLRSMCSVARSASFSDPKTSASVRTRIRAEISDIAKIHVTDASRQSAQGTVIRQRL